MTIVTKDNGKRKKEFEPERLRKSLEGIMNDFPELDSETYIDKIIKSISRLDTVTAENITKQATQRALERINIEESNPLWTFVASQILLKSMYKQASYNRFYSAKDKYGSLYGLLKNLGEQGIYSETILKNYSANEIMEAQKMIVPERDKLFTYIGLRTVLDRYLAKDYDKKIHELPQERFMIIALIQMVHEPVEKRMQLVNEAYWAMSNHYMTVATPTWSNAGLTSGQLSSCFIDTVDDSLRGIYDSNTDVATLSKGGGGIGVYMGKIRAKGSDIQGYKGASSGVIPWMKQLNNTAVSVDQLGRRQGSIAVYLDVWHKDIMSFLEVKLNNGDERVRTHDLFTGVSLPDLFMEKVEKRGEWYLFDPHEVRKVMGYSLEDFYDEEMGEGSFREKYEECVQSNELSRTKVEAIDIMKSIMKSQLETGTPYMFFRDTVNRANPNKHEGMIYSSNLCTEIMQNMSPTKVKEEVTEDGKLIITKDMGDFVVCNLNSTHLGNAVRDNVLARVVKIQMRMLDNIIDLNDIEVKQAKHTNNKYRGVGLGTFGWHQLLAQKGIMWESEEAVEYADSLYEDIAYYAIKASMELAKEKGHYPVFKGSEWHTGKYFTRRGYKGKRWEELMADVALYGVRNAWMMAVAPNATTSILTNGTASIDPVYKRFYNEEKKDYSIPVTAPDMSLNTFWFYKPAVEIDQIWSIRQNIRRQRHIDQAISFNLYVTNEIKAVKLLGYFLEAWRGGMKTTYYVRSTSIEVDECESCAS